MQNLEWKNPEYERPKVGEYVLCSIHGYPTVLRLCHIEKSVINVTLFKINRSYEYYWVNEGSLRTYEYEAITAWASIPEVKFDNKCKFEIEK